MQRERTARRLAHELGGQHHHRLATESDLEHVLTRTHVVRGELDRGHAMHECDPD